MRAGRLRYRAQVLELLPNLERRSYGDVWIDIRAKETADGSAPAGLRAPSRPEIRARKSERLQAGRYLACGERLFHMVAVRPYGMAPELVITVDELVGQPAEHRRQGEPFGACRAFVVFSAPLLDEFQQVADHRTRAELALIETGRVEPGDQLRVAGQLYAVTGYADNSDDGVVRGVWLEAI